jgi:tetratricopeptide (TPR) repeat protein
MYVDSRGLQITASAASSVELLDQAVSAYLGMRKDTVLRAAALQQADEGCVLGHCMNGYLAMHTCRRDQADRARQIILSAKKVAQSAGATRRERLHITALENWGVGKLEEAVDRWEEILVDFPLDILALRLAQFMSSYLGRSEAIRDSVARVLPAWSQEVPGYAFVLSCYAYGLEEAGEYETAERFGRKALELNPYDLWGAHAVVHVLEMQGRPAQGVEWIASTHGCWQECGNFVNHLWWHCALFHLAAGNYSGALELYDRKVNVPGDEYLDIANASALLWRIEQAGLDVGNRWEKLACQVSENLEHHFFVFVDLHYLLATAASHGSSRARDFLESCTRYATQDSTEAEVMRDVGASIAKAIIAHRQGAYGEAVDLLLPVSHLTYRIGGSHAQRDVFEQMLIDSAIRAGRFSLARSLLEERTKKRPRELWAWRTFALVSEKLGDTAGANSSHAEINSILARSDRSGHE